MSLPNSFQVGVAVDGPVNSPRTLTHWDKAFLAFAELNNVSTGEAYLSHFVFGPEMRSHYAQKGRSVREYFGPTWARWLVLDIDNHDLTKSLEDAKRLVVFMRRSFPEIDEKLPIYFSGAKGFHVYLQLPPVEPSLEFNKVCRRLAEGIASLAEIKIDPTIYDRNRVIRLPNTRHPKTGLYKRRIDADSFLEMGLDQILEHAKEPAGDGIPFVSGELPNVLRFWNEALRETQIKPERQQPSSPIEDERFRLPRYFFEFMAFGCEQGQRALMVFRCAALLTENGAPERLVSGILREPAENSGLPPAEVTRQIQSGIKHAQNQRGQNEHG